MPTTEGRSDAPAERSAARPWITPQLDRIPLKDALSGHRANGPFTDAMMTYPS